MINKEVQEIYKSLLSVVLSDFEEKDQNIIKEIIKEKKENVEFNTLLYTIGFIKSYLNKQNKSA